MPGPAPTMAALIAEGEKALADAGIGPARLEAEVLLSRRLNVGRTALILDPGQTVAVDAVEAFRADVARRASRYPLQYITGIQEFHSLEFEVDPRVLIPRAETEMLVDEVIERYARLAQGQPSALLIVDVGTGSGCIAVTLAVRLPGASLFASDVSEGALEVAARNAARHHVSDRVRFARGDGLAPAIDAGLAGRVEVLVSNPPYVPEAELAGLQPELAHEPSLALTPGPDGLSFTARLVRDGAALLKPGGRLVVELGAGSGAAARRLLDPSVWEDVAVRPDMQGIDRVLSARRR